MKICPKCHSDLLEKHSFILIKVVACVGIAYFIPMGIFVCWLPFLIPYKYECRNCHQRIAKQDIKQIDWREREQLLTLEADDDRPANIQELSKKQRMNNLEDRMQSQISKWFTDKNNDLYKTVSLNGDIFLVKLLKETCQVYWVTNYEVQPMPKTFGKQEQEIVSIMATKEGSVEKEIVDNPYLSTEEVNVWKTSNSSQQILALLKEEGVLKTTVINVQYVD